MTNLKKATDIFEDESMEYNIDDFDEQHIELEDLKENIYNLSANVVYYLQSPGNIFDIRIENMDEDISVSFEEHIYRKFWSGFISAERYINLKRKYFTDNLSELSIDTDFEDGCHLFFRIDFNTKQDNLLKMIDLVVALNDKFDKNIDRFKEEINNTINNFKFE